MRVYVIRHGESETNQAKKWTGWLNVHLTDKGKEDAQKAGIFLKNISFDKIYTSDLIRAIETAQNAIPSCRYETSALLREINVGNLANTPLSIVTDAQKSRTRAYGYAVRRSNRTFKFSGRLFLFRRVSIAGGLNAMTICAQRSQIRNNDLLDYTEVQSKLGIRRACAGFRCASVAYS